MLRRITYTVGWLTMVVPARVRGCANVGALTALDVPTQSERRPAEIETSPQMDSLVRPESHIGRADVCLAAPQCQPTDRAGLETAHSTEEPSSAANSHFIGSFRTWSTQRAISDKAGHAFSYSQPSAAPPRETATLAATADRPSNLQSTCHSDVDGAGRGHSSTSRSRHTGGGRATSIRDHIATIAEPSIAVRPCTVSEDESHETVRVTASRSSDVALVSPARRGAQSRFTPGERNPTNNHYHCGYCRLSWSNALVVCDHWVEKHGMARDEAVSVMTPQNPDLILDKPARRGPQPKRNPGEYNPKFKVYHCGHCSRQSTSEQVIRNHWMEKHGMSTEKAARVMTAQNPDLVLDKPARRGFQIKHKPGEYDPKFKRYHCGHCGFRSPYEGKMQDHWVEKHRMAPHEAARVMTAQNPDVSLDKLARRDFQPKRKPGEYNPKFKLYHCGHCSRQSTSEQVIRNHWLEKHGMARDEAARVMTAQNPDLVLDKRARRGFPPKRRPGEYNPKFKRYHCGHCGFRSPYEGKMQDHWVEKHGMSPEEAARVMTAQNPGIALDAPAEELQVLTWRNQRADQALLLRSTGII
jgi:predicted transposase YbfD/YdcC